MTLRGGTDDSRRAQLDELAMAQAPPKRAMTAYLIFCARHRNRIMREIHADPLKKFSRSEMQMVTTKLAAMWNNISQKELKEVRNEALKCKEEYEREKAKFPPALLKKMARMRNKPKGQIVVPARGEKPVRAKTAYLIFCSKHRNEIMRKIHKDPAAKFTRAEMQQVTTTLADMWNKISPSELAKCREEAQVELEKYKVLKAAYQPPVYGPAKKPKMMMQKGDLKPKKAPTAYLIFAEELRAKLKLERPDLKHDEISQQLSMEWKAIDPTKKKQYQMLAEAQRADLNAHGMLPSAGSLEAHQYPQMLGIANYSDVPPHAR